MELVAGSGVENGFMVANVRCSDCSSLDLRGSNNWISAWKKGEAINSADPAATITYHDGHYNFEVDFNQAKISSDSIPFSLADSKAQT